MPEKKIPESLTLEHLLDALSYAIFLIVCDEGHCDWWAQEQLELTDEEYEYVKEYGGYCKRYEEEYEKKYADCIQDMYYDNKENN